MDCSDIRRKLSDISGGLASLDDKVLIDQHLRDCRECAEYAGEIKKTIRILRDLEEVEPPAGLTRKVMEKIRVQAQPRKDWIRRLFFPLHIKLPLEAFAALMITVAAILIFKNMGPELQQMEVQPQAPVMKSMPAEPEREIQKKELQQPQRLQEKAKYKDSFAGIETRELTTQKEERPVEQPTPAPAVSFAPSPAPSSAMRQTETGKASGMPARDEVMQRAAPVSELSAEKKTDGLITLTVTVKALDTAKNEIDTYLARSGGELKTLEQSEVRIIVTVKLDPSKIPNFLAHIGSLGKIKEDRQALSLQSGLFKLIIEKQ